MKKFNSLLSCCLLTIVFASCEKVKDVPVASVTINQASAKLLVGGTVQLYATVLPEESSSKTVLWASSLQSVATVSSSGLVTAVSEGTAIIQASAGGKSGTCTIDVRKRIVKVDSIELDMVSTSLKVGETVTLTATVKPDDATYKTVTWRSSDVSVATVANGVVTAKKVGVADIIAKAGDMSATCTIAIIAEPNGTENVGEIEGNW